MSVQKKGNRWYVVLEGGRDSRSGKRRQHWIATGFTRKRDALDEEVRLKAQRLSGVDVKPTRTTLAGFLTEEWLPSMRTRIRPGTFQSYAQIARCHVIPRIGTYEMRNLNPGTLNRFYNELLESERADGSGGLSPKTVRNVHVVLHKALEDAVHWDRLPRNIASLANPPRLEKSQMPSWSVAQLSLFLGTTIDHPLFAAFRLIATTGMRRGEVLGLDWKDIDLDHKHLSVRRTLISVEYEAMHSEPKTAKGRRHITLDTGTVDALRTHKSGQLEQRMAAGPAWMGDGHVFVNEIGAVIHPDAFSKTFARLVASAGLPHMGVHGLRHTYATLALRDGWNPKIVSERLGHANVAITLDIYSHVTPGLQQDMTDQIAASIDGIG